MTKLCLEKDKRLFALICLVTDRYHLFSSDEMSNSSNPNRPRSFSTKSVPIPFHCHHISCYVIWSRGRRHSSNCFADSPNATNAGPDNVRVGGDKQCYFYVSEGSGNVCGFLSLPRLPCLVYESTSLFWQYTLPTRQTVNIYGPKRQWKTLTIYINTSKQASKQANKQTNRKYIRTFN